MGIVRLAGLFAIIPATLLLAVSFFVLFTIRKIETQGLKAFGYVVSALLWFSALLVFSAGIYTISTGRHPMISMTHQMKGEHKHGMMMGDQMPGMILPQK